jgi:hypothetical protein
MSTRTTDKNEPVWALCDFIVNAPTKRTATIRFEKCAVLYLKDEWAVRMLAEALDNYGT